MSAQKSVLIVMGSENDAPTVKAAVDALRDLEVPVSVAVASAHRSPDKAAELASQARDRGVGVIIAAAGMAHHLGGAVAARTTLPVVALPLASGALQGVDALLSAVQMPPGVPVAVVAVGGARNAALLAAQILSVTDQALAQRLDAARVKQTAKVQEADQRVQASLGVGG
jgi:5-(carboxyamino)imidazole ribonucleotide mutase